MPNRRRTNKYNEMINIVGSKEMGLEPEARANLIELLHWKDAPSGLVGGAVRMIQEAKSSREFKEMVMKLKSMKKMRKR